MLVAQPIAKDYVTQLRTVVKRKDGKDTEIYELL